MIITELPLIRDDNDYLGGWEGLEPHAWNREALRVLACSVAPVLGALLICWWRS